ncbi:glycosyltransferase family 4 protein [Falsiroseomonas sp. CW058]|uniref:glycosyltransferase family 4 protein n=1 Tax=Falsiroseomonas sp. CW058 TaxID=3388664 RepID=UPI003D322BA9
MRILLWYWGRRGGGAQFALGLARGLAGRGDVSLELSLSAQGELLPAFRAIGVPVHIVRTYRDRLGFVTSLPRMPAVSRALVDSARGAEVVVSAMTHLWTPWAAPRLARAGIPYVPVVHDAAPHPGDPAFAWDWRLGRELAAARAAVALSGAVAAELARRAPGLPVIRMPLPALLAAAPAPARPGATPGEVRFLFFGRLRAYKGLDLLRDAFALLHARHPGARLRVVGEGDAEACAPGLAALPGVTVEPRWVAEAEIPALLAEADAVVLPYREASQSGVAPQALAMGVPVVATPVGGLSEQVREGAGGVLAAAVTAESLAEAMARLCAPDALAPLRAEAARAGRDAADWGAASEALVAGLRRVLR